MAEVGQLRVVSQDYLDAIERMFDGLFNGPLPENLVGGDFHFPLFDGRDNLVDKAHEMVDAYNANHLRFGILDLSVVRPAVGKVLDALPQLIAAVDYALDHYAPVVSLFRGAANWSRYVMTPVSEIVGAIDRDIDKASLDWQDRGREIYSGDIVPHQRDAAAAAKDNAAYISNMLAEIGRANIDYATDMIQIVADVYARIVAIVIELASLVGSPFAIQDAAELVEKAINHFVGIVTAAVDHFAQTIVRVQNAENVLSDRTYFPDGQWPQAVERA